MDEWQQVDMIANNKQDYEQIPLVRNLLWIPTGYLLYYLFTLRHDDRLLPEFMRLRNLYLMGYVVVFVLVGLLIMLKSVIPEQIAKQIQLFIPAIVVHMILTIFSYAIILALSKVF